MTGLAYIGLDCIRRSDHGWFITMAAQSVMHRSSSNVIRTNGYVACDVVRTHGHVAGRSAPSE
jgi:hypothetical protein